MPLRHFIAQRQYLAVTVVILVALMLLLQWLVEYPEFGITLDQLTYTSATPTEPPWSVLSAHLVHLDWAHMWTNQLAFIAACALFWPILTSFRLLSVLALGAVGAALCATLLGVWLGQSYAFVGFSALTHAIVAFATVAVIRQRLDIRPYIGWLMAAAIVLKSTLELLPLTDAPHWLGQQVAGEAHLGGLIGGALVGLYLFCSKQPSAATH